jgi:hypothetical protein
VSPSAKIPLIVIVLSVQGNLASQMVKKRQYFGRFQQGMARRRKKPLEKQLTARMMHRRKKPLEKQLTARMMHRRKKATRKYRWPRL